LAAGIFLLAFFGFTLAREMLKNYEVTKEINALERQAAELESRNSELAILSKKLGTADFLEKEARLKFGLKKEGEAAAIIISPAKAGEPVGDAEPRVSGEEKISNLAKWWRYFFGPKN